MKNYGVLKIGILFCLSSIAWAQVDYSVLMQESPVGAGEIKPGIGVQAFKANQTVTLTTAPKNGYHFVCWLGDVRDPSANRTSMVVDGPKIIIAVFERDEYAFLAPRGPQISVGPPGVYPRYDSYTNSNGIDSPTPHYHDHPHYPDEPTEDPPPVPEVPEPATMMLLGVGAWLLRMNRKK